MKKIIVLALIIILDVGLLIGLTACNNKAPSRTIESKHNYMNGICKDCGLSASIWDGSSSAIGFNSGTGTEDNPYTIKTASEFIYFQKSSKNNTFSKKYVKLINNIDLAGNEIAPIEGFRGIFDGNGYSISAFKMSLARSGGLFQEMYGTIKNLFIANIYIGLGDGYSSVSVGGLVGDLIDGKIENCAVENIEIYIVSPSSIFSGGLVGDANNGSRISNSYVKGLTLYAENTKGRPTFFMNPYQIMIGGIVGRSGGNINCCYSDGEIKSKYKKQALGIHSGGIIGGMSGGTIKYCFTNCNIEVKAGNSNNRIGSVATSCIAHGSVSATDSYGIDGQTIILDGQTLQRSELSDQKQVSTSSLVGAIAIMKESWDSNSWSFTNREVPQLKIFIKFNQYCK